jgi:hypothetical protein
VAREQYLHKTELPEAVLKAVNLVDLYRDKVTRGFLGNVKEKLKIRTDISTTAFDEEQQTLFL